MIVALEAEDAARAAALFAVDPIGCGGIVLRAGAGPARDCFLADLRKLLPAGTPLRRIPLNIDDGRLLGGLDLAATLRTGRPVAERGLFADCDGGVIVLPMAERLAAATVGRVCAALDTGAVVVERDGLSARAAARFGVVALDESIGPDEAPAAAILDRLAMIVTLDAGLARPPYGPADIVAARERLGAVEIDDDVAKTLCRTALALGIASLRPSLLALKTACAAAALARRDRINAEDAAIAARLVLAPRATILPAPPESAEPPAERPRDDRDQPDSEAPLDPDQPLDDIVLAAARAAIPAGLLARLQADATRQRRFGATGRTGALQQALRRGRPAGSRPGDPRRGARLNLIDTLRSAAPWQRIRHVEALTRDPERILPRVLVARDDLRVTRLKHRRETLTIFVVDASGSSALNRLAEAKGAVELLLAECYVRRDRVALIAFRGRTAELLLPPTRSLSRAKRCLATLPGGGGTPIATALDVAAELAEAADRQGRTPTIITMTDGRANIGRDGTPGRAGAQADALAAAQRLKIAGRRSVLVDTAPSSQPAAARLAEAMGALYLPLPHADATSLARNIRATTL